MEFTNDPQVDQDFLNKIVKQRIFNEIAEFEYVDFENLKENKAYERFFVGNLKLTTGQVVCADPLYRELGFPQSWTVTPGEYPVFIYIGLDKDIQGRIAYAELVFSDDVPFWWEFSLIEDKLLEDDFERKMNGMFPVECGLGSFSDYKTWINYNEEITEFYLHNKEGNYYLDVLEKHFRLNSKTPKSSIGEDWINYLLSNSNENLIMFGSGRGDGLYPRYLGLDKNRKIVKLVVDFIQLKGT